jgi:serine/threonine protein phosphatase PrpC
MIYISTVSRRGLSHPDWNEDNLYYKQTSHAIIGGVFDGCSSGKDSYFASKLFANIYRKTLEAFNDDVNISRFQAIVYAFFQNIKNAIDAVGIEPDETLSTAVLFIYELNSNNLAVKFFGDGIAYINNQNLEIFNNDENNQPDYIGYSLTEILQENNFQKYWTLKKSFLRNTRDFSISTDGMLSFKKRNCEEPDFSFENYLVQDNFLYKNPASLKRKLNIIKNKGYDHEDDFTMIRVLILDE